MMTTPTIYRAPPDSSRLVLGRTLPSLLDEVCDRTPNEQAFNQWHHRRWQPLSNLDFRRAAEEVGLGLAALGLQRGERVAMVMHSDVDFCIVDMGCLLVGLVNVPIDLTQTIENILFILQHADARALVISNLELLYQLIPYLDEAPNLKWVIVAQVSADWNRVRGGVTNHEPTDDGSDNLSTPPDDCLHIPHLLEGHVDPPCPLSLLPEAIALMALAEVREQGQAQWSAEHMAACRAAIAPTDLATILYIASETKRPKGVMLTHENITADVLAAFSSHPTVQFGPEEVALLFLPLTHIFARVFLYGHLNYGHCIYFSDPNHLVKHLKTVRPTILITVPRLLEKIYERILDQERRLSKFDRAVFVWALKLAQRYELGQPLQRLYALQLRLADRLVYGRWRSLFGDRMKALICGGAALRADLANIFSAAGVPVLQGYGLTETSAVLCYNRGTYNRAGTVGVPIAGVEITIAADGEVLVRAPFVMQGYYRDPEATQKVLDADGWLHTGDVGEVTAAGFLKLTGIKKPLFKLTTGKYVSPLPLEQELKQSPLVAHAVTVGANHKFCGMLIVPNLDVLRGMLQGVELNEADVDWLHHPCIVGLYQSLIDTANCHLPYWSTVRKFRLIDASFTIENGRLLADGTLNRTAIAEQFAAEIHSLYSTDGDQPNAAASSTTLSVTYTCPPVSAFSCPTYAKSLTQH